MEILEILNSIPAILYVLLGSLIGVSVTFWYYKKEQRKQSVKSLEELYAKKEVEYLPGRISNLKEYPLKIVSPKNLGLSSFFAYVSLDSIASLKLKGLINAFPKIEEVIKEYDKIITEMQEKYGGAFTSVKEKLRLEKKCMEDATLKNRFEEDTTQILIDIIVTGDMKRIFELKPDVDDSSVMLMHRNFIKKHYPSLCKIRDRTKEIEEGERSYEKLYDASCRLKNSFLSEIEKR